LPPDEINTNKLTIPARTLGIERVEAEVLPEQKGEVIKRLQRVFPAHFGERQTLSEDYVHSCPFV
jgi:hypothetical protein